MYERLSAQAEPASVNETPLGTRPPAQPESPEPGPSAAPTAVPTIMMASLSNKNKRKGFKQAMANSLPQKIVFSRDAPAEQALPFAATSTSEIQSAAPSIFPRLVPPSERQASGQLPPNMFVTSVDVEEGMHGGKGRGKKKARPAGVRRETMEVEELVLDYGEPDEHISTQREPSSATTAGKDWSKVETGWDDYVKITDLAQVQVGATVGWKVRSTPLAAYNG